MYPILFSFGPIHIFAFSLGLIIAWIVYSFVLWRHLKDFGVEDDRIFDITFYSTLVAFIVARLWFVLSNWSLFADGILKIIAVWVVPGFSLWGAIIGGTLTSVLLARVLKVRIGFLFDSVAFAYPLMLIVGLVGSLLDGSRVGIFTKVPWAVNYLGHTDTRHPVQVYEILLLFIVWIIIMLFQKRATKNKWPYGLVGVWFFVLYAMIVFVLEYIQENTVYWFSLTVNQWVAVAFFCEGLGVLYVKGGLKDKTVPFVRHGKERIYLWLKGAYNAVSKRFTRPSPPTS
jgi:phosphatidylglycerol---prolipoprotein diacylglyceryl transferase